MPAIDLGFAISAAALDSDETFSRMKDAIGYVVNKYGTTRLRYAVIAFGSSPTTHINFGQAFPDPKYLKRLVASLPRSPGTPNLKEALVEAKKVFEFAPARPNSKKVRSL
jgi:hypothetical protein